MGAVLDGVSDERDLRLVERLRSGDQTAFAELYEAYHDKLLRFVRRKVRERHIAEDLTQEAFVRAYRSMSQLREQTRFYPWLTVIARHLVIDHYRANSRVTAVADLDPVGADAPELSLLRREEHDEVRAALDRVRGRHKRVLELRERDELSYEAIAEELGLSVAAVAPLLHRARLALRREYLALTDPERIGAFAPLLVGIGDLVRRMRDRLMQVAAYLPDGHAWGSSVAAVVISVGGIWGPVTSRAVERPPLWGAVPSDTRPTQDLLDAGGLSGEDGAMRPAQPGKSTDPHSPFPRAFASDRDISDARTRDRHMPHYYEIGDLSVGVDPAEIRRDLESSLAGDYRWMEE